MGVSEHVRQSTDFTALNTATEYGQFYAGCQLTKPWADYVGMPVDLFNFNSSLFVSALLAVLFRFLTAKTAGPLFRHILELAGGIGLLYFCFGHHIIHVFGQAVISYFIMRFVPARYEHVVTFIFCFTYLSVVHIFRQIYDYGGYTLDITLSLMMSTQRLTSLAFSVHDGFAEDLGTLPRDHKYLAIQRFPTLLEFFSYTFNFQGVIVGPLVHYADYISYIEGRNFTRFLMPANAEAIQQEEQQQDVTNRARPPSEITVVRVQLLHPSPKQLEQEKTIQMPLTQKQLFKSSLINGMKSMVIGVICGVVMMVFTPIFPMSRLAEPEFYTSTSFFYRLYFTWAIVFFAKLRYLFAWKFADGVGIISGLSYSGITKQGKVLWRLTDNMDIREFELGTRFAVHINAWNKTTATWLRFMIYDRVAWHPTLLTFTISALWHGFYPGYYIAFLTCAIFLHAVRCVRSTLRPVCELHWVPRIFYDICAFLLVRFGSAYMVLPYFLMTLASSYQVYRSIYFWGHAVAVGAIVIFPQLRRFLPESMRQKRVYGRARIKKHGDTTSSSLNTSGQLNMSSDDVDSGGNDSDYDPKKPKAE